MISKASDLELELVWIPKIMKMQEPEEINQESTIINNHRGLTPPDAKFITSIYKEYLLEDKHLTFNMATAIREILPKNWKQYYHMMNNT